MAPAPVAIEIGSGAEAYEPVSDGGPIRIIEGPQGGGRYYGYHVWVAALESGMNPTDMQFAWSVKDPADALLLGSSSYYANLSPLGDRYAAWGMRLILMDCCRAARHRLEIALTATAADGTSARAIRYVQTSSCPGGLPDRRLDPCR
jgi:hypothetical protein